MKTNIPFLENVIAHPLFRSGQATTTLIDTSPELFTFKAKRDRASKLLNFLGNVVVNGNPHAKGYRPVKPLPAVAGPGQDDRSAPPPGTRQLLLELGPKKFAEWTLKQKRLLVTDTTFRDAHQSLMATRVRSYDLLACAGFLARRAPELYSLEMWGGATFDTAMRFLNEDPWGRLRSCAAACPISAFRCFSAVPMPLDTPTIPTRSSPVCETRRGRRHGYFPDLRLAELPAEPPRRHGRGAGNPRRVRGRAGSTRKGDIRDAKRDISSRQSIT